MDSIYGNILDKGMVESAFLATYKKWFQTYSTRLEHIHDMRPKTIKQPNIWATSNSLDASKGENLPKLVVISPGLVGEPQLDGKQYSATWLVGCGVATSSETEEEAGLMVGIYAAVVRKIPIDNMNLDDTIPGIAAIRWVDEQYPDLPIDHPINLYKAAEVWFQIDINDVSSKWMGPDSPDTDPDTTFGQAQLVDIELVKDEILDD